jgi:hypothetical protein
MHSGRNCELADLKKPVSIADIQIFMASTKPKACDGKVLFFGTDAKVDTSNFHGCVAKVGILKSYHTIKFILDQVVYGPISSYHLFHLFSAHVGRLQGHHRQSRVPLVADTTATPMWPLAAMDDGDAAALPKSRAQISA